MNLLRFLVALLLTAQFIAACSSPQEARLTIATAANVQFAMDELAEQFSMQTGIPCDVILGSSGKLMAQIKEGAPYDVFVSADMMYPNTLFNAGLTTGPPQIYAYGSLVLWTMKSQLPDLSTLPISGKIAMANPETAPYGRAARQALEHDGLYEKLREHLVFGENIAQTNQFIISETAIAGFTAKSVVLSPVMKSKGKWKDVDPSTHDPITQGVVVTTARDEMKEKAIQFQEFLLTPGAQAILKKYGYIVSP